MNPASLMEVPPNEEELEKILDEADTKESTKKNEVEPSDEEEENTDEDKTDYSAMKVAELKELLKERELPVSGTKAELIKRLQS